MAKGMEIFSEAEDYGLQDRVDAMWEFVEGFPLPKFELSCGCGSKEIKLMAYTFMRKDEIHVTQEGGQRNACAIMFRCWTCGALSEYTAAFSDEIWDLRSNDGQAAMYHWEKALKIIQEAQNGNHPVPGTSDTGRVNGGERDTAGRTNPGAVGNSTAPDGANVAKR